MVYYQNVDEFSILHKNDLVSSAFGQTNIKNRIVDILRKRYQGKYPKSNLDLSNVGQTIASSRFVRKVSLNTITVKHLDQVRSMTEKRAEIGKKAEDFSVAGSEWRGVPALGDEGQ